MVRAALIDSGNPTPAFKNSIGINAIVSGARPFFAVIRERHRQNCTARMLAHSPGSGAL
jgi:hypothetical protein